MQKQIRQGDVYLRPAGDFKLDGAKVIAPVNGRFILAEGEATGHHHSVTAETCGLFDMVGKTVLVVNETTQLTHQEHGTIEVAPGMYFVVRQREYAPEAPRRVMD